MDNGLIVILLGVKFTGKTNITYLIVFFGTHLMVKSTFGNIQMQLSQKENKV